MEDTRYIVSTPPGFVARSLDRRDVLGLHAYAPVKNTGKTRYNSQS